MPLRQHPSESSMRFLQRSGRGARGVASEDNPGASRKRYAVRVSHCDTPPVRSARHARHNARGPSPTVTPTT
jgi:hypothetical protein